jgi:aspartate/methionine/tyrosine aminotransferase
LDGARVAAVAGLDFGPAHAAHTMRFAYTTGLERLQEAIHRMKTFLG